MARKPRIPMRPIDLPQQRLYLVKGQPLRPPNWSGTVGEPARDVTPVAMPKSARCIGQVEWAWSSMHMRIDAYYLSMDRPHRRWLLWIKPYDDNWGRWGDASVAAHALRNAVGSADGARLLLIDFWTKERDDGTDRFHWINEDGLLEAGDLSEIAAFVWYGESLGDADGASS